MLRHGFWRSSPAIMTNHSESPSAIPAAKRIGLPGSSARTEPIRVDGWVYVYARLALGAAFLSAVASRFGLWDRTLDLKHFAKFLEYTAEVNSFMPPATIPLLAWAATVAETSLGILLISGWWSRWVSLASAVLLAMFGTAMAISFGLKSPMDYSVFSASAAAALLAQRAFRQHRQQSSPNRM
jgi:putative oxidoreductase